MNKLNNKETDLWDLCGQITSPPVPSKDEVWMRLEQHIDILDQKAPNGNTITKPIWIKWQPRFVYAFLLAFLLIMPTTIRYLNTNTVSSEFGMINRNVILSDGTSIQLNADSKISYGSNYGNGNRNVSLKGEAFFNVTPSNVPFIVSTDYAKVTVLGTKFNVRARDDGFETGVNEGSVEINKNDKSLVLSEGQRALIESKNAYVCFYSKDRVAELKKSEIARKSAAEFDKKFQMLSVNEAKERMKNEDYVVRLKMPSDGEVVINDEVNGVEVELQVSDGGYGIEFNNSGVPIDFGSAPFKPVFTTF